MKKFILLMVFILLTALFIAFNYLIWDRESKITELKNLEYANAGNNADISAKKREIQTLEEELSTLGDRIEQLENEKAQLIEEKSALVAESIEKDSTLNERINFINTLKQYTDLSVFSEPLKQWSDALNQGNFEEAYAVEYAGIAVKDRTISLNDYVAQMKNTIKKVEIVEFSVDKLRGSGTGDIYLEVRINAKLVEDSKGLAGRFNEGENEVYVKFDYSAEKKSFVISGMNNM